MKVKESAVRGWGAEGATGGVLGAVGGASGAVLGCDGIGSWRTQFEPARAKPPTMANLHGRKVPRNL